MEPLPESEVVAGSVPGDDDGATDETDVERRCAVVDMSGHGERLDRCLVRVAPEFSRTYLQGLVAGGHVRVAGKVVTASARRMVAGEALELNLVPTARSTAFRAEAVPLQVVYEDEHVRVIDKPAGLVVHPAPGNWSGTLLNGLLARDATAFALPRAGIVHRLDKDTSGLMVVARTQPAMVALVRAIAVRAVRREYLAIAHGMVALTQPGIERPIGRDPVSRVRMAVVADGRPARTDVVVQGRAQGCSALRCTLHTGRTHQIRVHLASIGHPLVSDTLYGGRPALGMTRQALHATRLGFDHPVSGEPLMFEARPPEDFAQAWGQLFLPG